MTTYFAIGFTVALMGTARARGRCSLSDAAFGFAAMVLLWPLIPVILLGGDE